MAFFHESIPPGLLNRLKGLAERFVFAEIFKLLKGECHKIFTFFLLKRFDLGPKWTDKNGFANFFDFSEDIHSQSLKIACQRSCWLRGYTTFSLEKEVLIVLNYCYIGCVTTISAYDKRFFARISLQKQIISQNSFCQFVWGPGQIF